MPDGVTRIGQLLLFSEQEFLDGLDQSLHTLGRVCYRSAKSCAAAVIAAGPGTSGGGSSFTPTFSPVFSPTFNPTQTFKPKFNIIMPQSGAAPALAPVSQGKAFPKSSREEEERPADIHKKQTNIAALFGKPPPSFTGMSDKKVLQAVKWAPIESGGHTAGSKVSFFRNKFMADFVRENPSLAFDKAAEKDIRARSLTAYETREAGVVVESGDGDALSGFLFVGPEKDDIQETEKEKEKQSSSQVEPMINVVEEEVHVQPGKQTNESAKSAQAKVAAKRKAPKRLERGADMEDETLRKVGKLMKKRPSALAIFEQPMEVPGTAIEHHSDESQLHVEAEKGQGEKRPLADNVESDSSDVDLVQEAVNPNGKSVTNSQLKVCTLYLFISFIAHFQRHGCVNTDLPLEVTSPSWSNEWRVR